MFTKDTMLRDAIIGIVSTLITAWIIWISYETVENKRISDLEDANIRKSVELNEFRLDTLSPVLQGLSEGR